MNQKMYIATWDTQIVLVTKPYSHWINEILSNDASFNIDENSVRNTLKCVRYVQQISGMYILLNRSYSWIKLYILLRVRGKYFLRQSDIDVEKSKFWASIHHSILIKMLSLTHCNLSDNVHKYQLCTSNLSVPTHEANYVYRYIRPANILVTKRYTHWLMDILSTGASFNIDENSVPHTLKCVWQGP